MTKRFRLLLFSGLVALLATVLSPATMAQDEKPFADQKFVLQISDMDPDKQTLVLNVAGNIIKAYGQDKADVEIVAFGPGLRLLFAENSNAGRIEGLTTSGVRFSACKNTIANMTKILGYAPKINPHAKTDKGGVYRIKELTDQGYLLVKP